jgi:hypothetical protein
MHPFLELKSLVEESAKFGERTTSLGAHLYGHVPHVAPEAWLHSIYAGLSPQELDSLELKVGRPIPSVLRDFLAHTNGINLFSGHLSIYGLRSTYNRTGDAAWQPFALEVPNTQERPRDAKESYFFFGGYFDDGSRLVIDCETSKVLRLPQRKAAPILTEWPDFWSMLLSEAHRLSLLFDEVGRLRDESAPTTPPNA